MCIFLLPQIAGEAHEAIEKGIGISLCGVRTLNSNVYFCNPFLPRFVPIF